MYNRCVRESSPEQRVRCCSTQSATATSIVDVTTSTGKTWMDRNLGAAEVAASSTDPASYGDLYQWGRAADGHEKRTSVITAGPVAAGSEGANFITTSDSPRDWLSTKDDTRWGATKTAHDPCPTGYRVPTAAELDAELNEFSPKDIDGAFESALKLSAACRRLDNGNFEFVGSGGFYWSRYFASKILSFVIPNLFRNQGDKSGCFGFSIVSEKKPKG